MLAVGLITAMAAISGTIWASLSKAAAGESADAPLPVFPAWVFDVLLSIFYVPGARQLWMAVVFRVGVMYLLLHPIITGNLDLHASSGETTAEKL